MPPTPLSSDTRSDTSQPPTCRDWTLSVSTGPNGAARLFGSWSPRPPAKHDSQSSAPHREEASAVRSHGSERFPATLGRVARRHPARSAAWRRACDQLGTGRCALVSSRCLPRNGTRTAGWHERATSDRPRWQRSRRQTPFKGAVRGWQLKDLV